MFRNSVKSLLVLCLGACLVVSFSAPSAAKDHERASPGQVIPGEVHLSLPDSLTAGQHLDQPDGPDAQSVVIFTQEDFEGAFPTGLWQVFDADGATNGEHYWGVDDYLPGSGSGSAWAARSGAEGLDPEFNLYPNNADAWMIFGPVDLSGASSAEVLFDYNNRSEESYDFFTWATSVDGVNFYGYKVSGDSEFWESEVFDLTAVPTLGDVSGAAAVWIGFTFQSDGSVTRQGPFVDNIVFRGYFGNPDPFVSSIVSADANPTRAAAVDFLVAFSEDVTGVDSGDFALTVEGLTGTGITGVTGSGQTYTVTVQTGTGDGKLRLDLIDDDSIVDASAQPLGGLGAGNGTYTNGETYTLDHTPPSVSSIARSGLSPTGATTIKFAVQFDEAVIGVDIADFSLATSGISGAAITSVFGSGPSYVVKVTTGSDDGTIRLDLADDDSIADLAGNVLGGTGAGNGNFSAGETYTLDRSLHAWESNGPYGGELNCLAKAPTNPDVMYAGTDSGIFKSTNNGADWFRVGFAKIAVYSCQVSQAGADVVFAGTGDGIYRSNDGGASWSEIGLAGAEINTIAIHPANPDILLAGAGWLRMSSESEIIGIFKSEDGGSTWNRKDSAELDTVEAIIFDVDDPSYVYAGVKGDNCGSSFYRSSDGGNTWSSRQVGQYDCDGILALGMTPAGANPRVIYAVNPWEEDVYRSEDRGETWSPTGIPATSYAPCAVAVDPNAASVVYVSGGLYKSPDAGATWLERSSGLPSWNSSAIVIDPRDSRLFVAQESGGIFTSADGADSWQSASEGLLNTSVTGLALHPTSSERVYATLAGWGYALETSADGGGTWNRLESSWRNLGAVGLDPQQPETIYVGWDYNEEIRRSGAVRLVSKTVDGGQTWNSTGAMFTISSPNYGYAGVSNILVSPVNSNVVLAAVEGFSLEGGGVYKSSNGGAGWSRKLSFWIATLAADPNNPNVYYAGTARYGYVFRSTNGGDTWSNIGPGGNYLAWEVRDIEVAANGDIFVATSNGLWHWNGTGWAELTALPTTDVTALAIDLSQGAIYAGTGENGVYVSEDGGSTWSELNDNLDELSITKLALANAIPKTLYAGAQYGGVWSLVLGESTPDNWVYIPLLARGAVVEDRAMLDLGR